LTIELYDLAGAEDDRRFSPNCWRVTMALAHKGLAYRTIPWRFTEKDAIAFSAQGTVPVLVDAGEVVSDSWRIALYLDRKYDVSPPMDGAPARGSIFVLKNWLERALHPAVLKVIVLDLFAHLHEKDKRYFRESREKRFGMALEAFASDESAALVALRQALDPVRPVLAAQPFLGGDAPSFADYLLFGPFQWARVMSPKRLLDPEDPIFAWRERMLDLHGGLAGALSLDRLLGIR
jgi:glutathione S-transferase